MTAPHRLDAMALRRILADEFQAEGLHSSARRLRDPQRELLGTSVIALRAMQRVAEALRQPDMFIERPRAAKQEALPL